MRSRLGIRLAPFRRRRRARSRRRSCPPPPAPAPAEQLILRVGTDQKLETLNPWQSITYADYEMFQIQYELLVSFGNDLEPAPGLRRHVGVVRPTR